MKFEARDSAAPLTLDHMRADVASVLGVPVADIADDDFLPDLGLDSIRAMVLVDRWSKAGAKIDFAALAEHATLAEWAVLLCA